MQPELTVGIDEFTVILMPTEKTACDYWAEKLEAMLAAFIPKTMLEELFGKLSEVSNKLLPGYNRALSFDDRPWYLSISWHDDYPNTGICIKFSAHAWTAYQAEYKSRFSTTVSVADFLRMVQDDLYTTRLSRIDLTADYKDYPNAYQTGYLHPNEIYRHLIDGSYVIKDFRDRRSVRTFSAFDKNGAYETFYAGSLKGKTRYFLRCYDKRAEQIDKKGFRYEEAIACTSWVRFEAVFKGTYAHQMTRQLIETIHTQSELQQFIATHITNKFRIQNTATEDAINITNDLLAVAAGSQINALSTPNARDNSLYQSIQYLKQSSGLYAVLYKIYTIWGEDGEKYVLDALYKDYQRYYRPEAHKNRDIRCWLRKHEKELRTQSLNQLL